mgnify:CR=1 FL=1
MCTLNAGETSDAGMLFVTSDVRRNLVVECISFSARQKEKAKIKRKHVGGVALALHEPTARNKNGLRKGRSVDEQEVGKVKASTRQRTDSAYRTLHVSDQGP